MVLMGTRPFEPFDFFEPLLPDCKLIVSASAGYNEFPVDWMTENGIWFCNTRNAIAEPTADMAILLTLAVVRDLTGAQKSARAGLWRNDHVPCTDPTGLTLGIIGLGAIGKVCAAFIPHLEKSVINFPKHLARKAAVFNMRVQYYNRTQLSSADEALYKATYCSTLENLLQTSDVISVNCPLDAATTNLISHKEFAQMKDGVFFVNTARGPIVNEEALIGALESGKVARAGLDVFEDEPSIKKYFMESDKCIIQPHLGGLTNRAEIDGETECFENIKALFKTGRPIAPVNEIVAE